MNLLWSYAYARRHNVDQVVEEQFRVPRVRFFADSGAHSARTLGLHLDVDSYATWLRKWQHHFTVYANLDVIYGPQATWNNQRALEDHGLSPMPVFHTGEPWSWLERYLEDGYTYIALGKLLGNPWTKLRPWLAKAFRIAGDTAVFHGFGLTSLKALAEFPFYSVDSSSWGSAYRYGELVLFDRGRWVKVRLRNKEDVLAHRNLLEDYGVPFRALSRTGYDRRVVAETSALSYIRAGEWMARRHGPILLPPGKGYPPSPSGARTVPAGEANRFTLYLAETTVVRQANHANVVRTGVA
jgi:hypothetical protein